MVEEKVTYKRKIGTDSDHGTKYEWYTTCLAYVRSEGLHRNYLRPDMPGVNSYLLANNVHDIDVIDDVVVRVEYKEGGGVKKKLILVQCKHVEDPKKLNKEKELLSESMIKKYFNSFVNLFRNILKNDDEETQGSTLRDIFNCTISDCEMLLYTNFIKKEGKAKNVIRNGSEYVSTGKSERDISYEIFNTADSHSKPITLEPQTLNNLKKFDLKDFNEEEFNYLKEEFAKRFRIYHSQVVNIEFEIGKLIERNHLIDNVSIHLNEELRHIFGKGECEFLNENSELLHRVENFSLLKSKSTRKQEDLFCGLRSKSLFSTDVLEDLNDQIKPKHTSEIATPCVELEKHKLIQLSIDLLMTKKENNFIVFVDTEADFDIWKVARKTKIYDNFKVFIVCSDISKEFPGLKNNEFGIKFIPSNERNDALDINNLGISMETIELISNYSVSFQGVTVNIKEIWENASCKRLSEKTLFNILSKKEIKIEKPQLPALDWYSQSKLNVKVLKKSYAQGLQNRLQKMNKGHIFLLCTENNLINRDNTKGFESIGEARESIKKLKETNDEYDDQMLFCLRRTDDIELLHSFGKESKHVEERSYNIHENQKITFLSGANGSDITSASHSLALQYEKKNPSHWTYFIELKNCCQQFQYPQRDLDDTTKAVQFLATNILNLENLELSIFEKNCKEDGKSAIFFDSFDKLDKNERKKFISLLFALEKTKLSHIFVSSKTIEASELENAFSFNAIQLIETVTNVTTK